MVTSPFHPVPDIATLEDWLARSAAAPVVFFNYDRYCPINTFAYHELARCAVPIALVDVTRDHGVKQALAARTGVRHESPQAIVVHAGRVIWSASHFAIRGDLVAEAVERAAATPADGDVPPDQAMPGAPPA